MGHMALLVIDVQTALIEQHPYNEQQVIHNLQQLITTARKHGHEVIYVRHDDGEDTELEAGTAGWQIYKDIEPLSHEFIVDKNYNSAFHKTQLRAYLESKSVNTLIIAGLQTEYCIDATLKSAFDHGYNLIIPKGAHTTFGNEYLSGEELYHFYNEKIWAGRFAKVLAMGEVVELMKEPS